MARVLDLNTVQSSFLDITLRDKDRTVVHLDIPDEATINELQNIQAELERMKTGDRASIAVIYDLAARLISCNLDFFKVTGNELLTTYGMNAVLTLNFLSAYMAAIEDLANAKN